MEMYGATATNTWLMALEHTLSSGTPTMPRGLPCREILNAHTTTPMYKPIVTTPARHLGYRFMFAEAYWILTGDNRVSTIAPYSKSISQFSDNGKIFSGAYGPMVVEQVDYVVRALTKDLNTRQAIMTIWRPSPPPSKDIPCTVAVQFIVRDGYLHCIDTMRSSDVWLGWPYDTFNFSMLSAYIILCLYENTGIKLQLGNLHMNLGSLHLYEENVEQARLCITPPYDAQRKFRYPFLDPITEFGTGGNLLRHLNAVAEQRAGDLKSTWVHCVAEGKHNK